MSNSSLSSYEYSVERQEEVQPKISNDPKSNSSASFLSLLDDKNKLIAALQKKLQNQKLQLTYYIQKELSSSKILQLSQSCSPQAMEESLAVNLAMNNFNKQMGIKSKILGLYERMSYIDEKISSSLQDQEFILRKIVNKLCEFVKHANGNIEFRVQFSNFITDPFHVELFNKLLNATINLRKKLDTFRICCNRLMIIEDERNSIVEQVYSLPAEQRTNCNYLISIQMEKIQLESEMKRILEDRGRDRERIKELNIIEEKLANLQLQLNATFVGNDESCSINKMLQKVTSEAKLLLELTKEQRRKYEREILRARCQKNLSVERTLTYIRMAMENKEPEKKDLIENGFTSKENLLIFECIKKEIDKVKDKFACKIRDELQSKKKECENLKNKLNQVMFEKKELKIANLHLQREFNEYKFNQNQDILRLKEERNAYKSQVEDLEAIREAYAQLVDRQPNTSNIEREYVKEIKEKDKQIEELERHNVKLANESNVMKNTISRQGKEIKLQHELMTQMKKYSENFENIEKQTSQSINCMFKKQSYDKDSSKDVLLCCENIADSEELMDEISYEEVCEQEIYFEEVLNLVEPEFYTLAKTKQVFIHSDGSGIGTHNKIRRRANDVKEKEYWISKILVNQRREDKDSATSSDNETSIACFAILKNQGRSSDVVETVITGTEESVEESIRMTDSSSFCLEINYKPKVSSRANNVKLPKCEEEIDEYELMRDCSEEAIPVVCLPRNKAKGRIDNLSKSINCNQISSRKKYVKPESSKLIEVLAQPENHISSSSEEFVKYVYRTKF